MDKKTVLIVDDEKGVRETLGGILKDEGYKVVTAKTGNQALKLLKTKSIDLVFLDICLPALNGLEILKEIKSRKENLPVIITGTRVSTDVIVEVIKKGAFNFLEKPLSLEKLLVLAKRAIEEKWTN